MHTMNPYLDRAKGIKNSATVNEIAHDKLLIRELNVENEKLLKMVADQAKVGASKGKARVHF